MGHIISLFQMRHHTAAFTLNARCERIHIYPGALVVEFFLMFPSHIIWILLSGNGSNGSPTRRPRKRDDRTLNLAGRCLPPMIVLLGADTCCSHKWYTRSARREKSSQVKVRQVAVTSHWRLIDYVKVTDSHNTDLRRPPMGTWSGPISTTTKHI